MTTDWPALHSALSGAEADYTSLYTTLTTERTDHAAEVASLNSQIAGQATSIAGLQGTIAGLRADLARVQADFDAYRLAHPDTTPPPDPDPEPPVPSFATPLLGMSSPPDLWADRKTQVEATGGRLQARRLFFQNLSDDPTTLVKKAFAEGLYPVISFKIEPYTWAQVANGAADNALKTLAARLKALDKPLFFCAHHEPDTKSNPADQGEGGSAADFARMTGHILDVMKPLVPKAQFGVCMNGWWWSAKGGLTDAQIEVWLPRALRERLDVIAADDYSPDGGEESVVKTKNRATWAKRVGGVKAIGIGEFNGWKPTDLTNVINYAKVEPLFRNGWLLVWNSTGKTYQPLEETGLVDDFQKALKDWTA